MSIGYSFNWVISMEAVGVPERHIQFTGRTLHTTRRYQKPVVLQGFSTEASLPHSKSSLPGVRADHPDNGPARDPDTVPCKVAGHRLDEDPPEEAAVWTRTCHMAHMLIDFNPFRHTWIPQETRLDPPHLNVLPGVLTSAACETSQAAQDSEGDVASLKIRFLEILSSLIPSKKGFSDNSLARIERNVAQNEML